MDDRDLGRLFTDARATDERHVPPFARVLAHRRTPARGAYRRWSFAVAAVALVAILVWRTSTPNAPTMVIALTPGDMRVPTDYLLDMVTYPRAGEIPRIGISDWYPLRFDDAAAPNRRLP